MKKIFVLSEIDFVEGTFGTWQFDSLEEATNKMNEYFDEFISDYSLDEDEYSREATICEGQSNDGQVWLRYDVKTYEA